MPGNNSKNLIRQIIITKCVQLTVHFAWVKMKLLNDNTIIGSSTVISSRSPSLPLSSSLSYALSLLLVDFTRRPLFSTGCHAFSFFGTLSPNVMEVWWITRCLLALWTHVFWLGESCPLERLMRWQWRRHYFMGKRRRFFVITAWESGHLLILNRFQIRDEKFAFRSFQICRRVGHSLRWP